MLLGTTALAPTVAPWLMTAQCNTTLPEPASDSSSRVQPSRWVRCPTTQPSPMTVGKPGTGVDHGAVLNGRARADRDRPVVAAQDGARPHARLGADGHVADDDGVGVDEGVGVDARRHAVELVEGHGSGRYTWPAIQVTP